MAIKEEMLVPTAFLKGLYDTLRQLEVHMDEQDLGPLKYNDVENLVSSLTYGLLEAGFEGHEL